MPTQTMALVVAGLSLLATVIALMITDGAERRDEYKEYE